MIILFRKCYKYFLFAGFFSLFINTLQLTFSLYMLAVYDGVLTSYSMPTLEIVTVLALAALVVWGVLEFCRSRLLVLAGIRLNNLLSRRVLKGMLEDLSRADSVRYTEGLKDINTLRNYLGGNTVFAFFDVPWIFIYLGIIYIVHPVLGLVATGGAVVVFVLGLVQHLLTRKDLQGAAVWAGRGRRWVLTSFRTARELQSMGMISGATAGFNKINDDELLFQDRAGNYSHIISSISQGFGVLMQVVIFGAGATLVLSNQANPGVIIAASIIMGQALAPIRLVIGAWKQTVEARTAYSNLHRLLQMSDQKQSLEIAPLTGELKIKNVFLDIRGKVVLQSIDFSLQQGDIMGLIGPNGAGKSSLCRLILGVWAPTKGVATLAEQDVFHLANDSLGKFIGYLPQNVELFTGTVKENIARMGAIDSEKVIRAACNAGAHETILGFPQGYDTDIGEAGLSLSGGQRQRVGLARALYGEPSLVILDEPNSNLDDAGEQALVSVLLRLKAMGTTTVMITHKLSLLNTVDKILVLQNGQQVQFGSREKVLGNVAGVGVCKQ